MRIIIIIIKNNKNKGEKIINLLNEWMNELVKEEEEDENKNS